MKQICCFRILSDSCNAFQQVPSSAGSALQGRSEGCGVLQAVKMMATVTKMQSVHGFHRTCSVHELWRVGVLFFSIITIGLSVIFLFVVVFNGCKRSKKQNKQTKKALPHSKQAAGTSKRVCLLQLDGKAVWIPVCLKQRLTLCSMLLEGATTNRFSNISSFEFQHQAWK